MNSTRLHFNLHDRHVRSSLSKIKERRNEGKKVGGNECHAHNSNLTRKLKQIRCLTFDSKCLQKKCKYANLAPPEGSS